LSTEAKLNTMPISNLAFKTICTDICLHAALNYYTVIYTPNSTAYGAFLEFYNSTGNTKRV